MYIRPKGVIRLTYPVDTGVWKADVVTLTDAAGKKTKALHVIVDTRKGTNPVMEALLPVPETE